MSSISIRGYEGSERCVRSNGWGKVREVIEQVINFNQIICV